MGSTRGQTYYHLVETLRRDIKSTSGKILTRRKSLLAGVPPLPQQKKEKRINQRKKGAADEQTESLCVVKNKSVK